MTILVFAGLILTTTVAIIWRLAIKSAKPPTWSEPVVAPAVQENRELLTWITSALEAKKRPYCPFCQVKDNPVILNGILEIPARYPRGCVATLSITCKTCCTMTYIDPVELGLASIRDGKLHWHCDEVPETPITPTRPKLTLVKS